MRREPSIAVIIALFIVLPLLAAMMVNALG